MQNSDHIANYDALVDSWAALEESWMDNSDHRETHIATGSESLAEFAHNAGMDNPEKCWLLDDRDVWVKNPFFQGEEERHPEDDSPEDYE